MPRISLLAAVLLCAGLNAALGAATARFEVKSTKGQAVADAVISLVPMSV